MSYGLFNPEDSYTKPKFWLAKPNKEVVSRLKEADKKASLNVDFGKVNELEIELALEVIRNHVSIDNVNAKTVANKFLIKMQFMSKVEWFVIEGVSKNYQDGGNIPVSALSLQSELIYKKIYNMNEVSKTPEEILDIVLIGTVWKIGIIDVVLRDKHRSFEFSNTSVLDALYTIAEIYDGVLSFDTVNQTISILSEENASPHSGLMLNDKNYIESINDNHDGKTIITRLYPIGAEGLTINSVNPLGTAYIEDLSYFFKPF